MRVHLDKPPCGELNGRLGFCARDAKRTFEDTKVVEVLSLQQMRAMWRKKNHQNPQRRACVKHFVYDVRVVSVAYHDRRILRRHVRDTRYKMILYPRREVEAVERSL